MKRILCIILIFILCLSTSLIAFGTETEGVLPSGTTYSKIEGVIDDYVDEHKNTTAAVSVAVFTDSNVIMEKAYGYSNIENAIVNDKDTVFEWGSITKLLTWTSVMQLSEKSKIDLNKDIRTYLPNGFFKKLKYDTPITMLNLMNHNAGWQETVTDLFIKDKKDVKKLEDILQMTEPEQIYKPGTFVAYSNWGVALAGYIVERVSGQTFDKYVHDHVFKPLGMEHTALSATLSDNEWVAKKRAQEKCYTTNKESLGTSNYYISLYPAGMATGTISDFVKFGQALLSDKSKKSLLFEKEETLDEMLSPSLFFADGKTARNYHGFWTDEFAVPVLFHNGGTIGSTSWFTFDPKSGTGMIIFTNQSGEFIYNCGLLPKVFGKYKSEKGRVTAEDISGIYLSSRTCLKGVAKPYSLISTMRLVSKGDGIYAVQGTHNTVTAIGRASYIFDMGGVKQFITYATTDEKGHKVLQQSASDYVEVNGYGVIAEYILLMLFVLSALYGLIELIITLVRLLKYKRTLERMEIYRLVVNISVIIAAVVCAYISVKLLSSLASRSDIIWSVMLNGVFALFPVVYAIILAGKWKKLHCARKEKIRLIMTGIAGLIMTVNIIFWETYKFW